MIIEHPNDINGVSLSAFGKVYLEVKKDKRILVKGRIETRTMQIAEALLEWSRAFAEETSLNAPSQIQRVPIAELEVLSQIYNPPTESVEDLIAEVTNAKELDVVPLDVPKHKPKGKKDK